MPHRLGLIEQMSGAIEQTPGRGSERLSGIGPMIWERDWLSPPPTSFSHMQSERGRCSIPSANLGPGLARPPAPTAGAFFFGEFVTSADSFLLPHLRRRSHRCQAMAAKNKCLAQSNKSRAGGKATKKRIRQICVLSEVDFTKL